MIFWVKKNAKIYKALIDDEFTETFSLNIISKIKDLKVDKRYDSDSIKKLILGHIKFQNPIVKDEKRKIAVFIGTTGCG